MSSLPPSAMAWGAWCTEPCEDGRSLDTLSTRQLRCRSGAEPSLLARPLLDRFLGFLALRPLLGDHPVSQVVLVDVRHVGHRLATDLLRGDQLDIVEPDVRIEAALGGQLAELGDPAQIGRAH